MDNPRHTATPDAAAAKDAVAQRQGQREARDLFDISGQDLYAVGALLALVALGLLHASMTQWCTC